MSMKKSRIVHCVQLRGKAVQYGERQGDASAVQRRVRTSSVCKRLRGGAVGLDQPLSAPSRRRDVDAEPHDSEAPGVRR